MFIAAARRRLNCCSCSLETEKEINLAFKFLAITCSDSPLSEILLPELLFYVRTEWDQTLVFFAMFGVIATQGDKLFANRAAPVGFPFAVLRVSNDTFHLLA